MNSVCHYWSKEPTIQGGLILKSFGQELNCENTLLEYTRLNCMFKCVHSVKTPEEMTFLREY